MTAFSRVWIAAFGPLVSKTSMFVPTIMQTWNDDEAMVMDECHQEAYRTDADGAITGYTHITSSTDASGATSSWTNHYDANWALTEAGYGALEEVLNGGIGTEVPTDCADVDEFVFIFEAECNGFCTVETHSLEEFITYSLPCDFENESDDDAFIVNSLVYLGDTVVASDNIIM